MKLIRKIGIFAVALMLSLVGFSLMASPTLSMLQAYHMERVEAAPVTIDVRG
ncbi:MAG: hypothetical protein PHI34_01905 [Acidobacteriota bacterium]|nr:hypothetical protein [Acidobacteriota bacterium]